MLYQNHSRLAAAVLIRMVDDWGKPTDRPDIEKFLRSEWFKELAWLAGMRPRQVRLLLKTDAYDKDVSRRAAYRKGVRKNG